MPSDLALAQAAHVKESIDLTSFADEQFIPASQWFTPDSSHVKTIPYPSIAHHADLEYIRWRAVNPHAEYTFDATDNLKRWVRNSTEAEIAELIDTTPPGVANGEGGNLLCIPFTPWQRLTIALWVSPPYSVTSKVTIDADALRLIAQYGPRDTPRKMPIQAEFSMLEGTIPDLSIIDLPTASGKTALSLAIAFTLLSSPVYPRLCTEHRSKLSGSIFQGKATVRVARMAIVAVSATTFHHFVDTLHRSIVEWTKMEPGVVITVWSTMGKSYSVSQVADRLPPNHIVFWVIPVKELNKVLRDAPDVAVAVCLTDEFTVDTPKEKSRTFRSPVLKHLITQATPQALQQTTHGNRSLLKEAFGGVLHAPCFIGTLILRRQYSEAQLACEQLCRLDLMTMTHLRDFVRRDLVRLMPTGLQVNFVRSKRCTISSHLLGMQVDMVPASFLNVLLHHIHGMFCSASSILQFKTEMEQDTVIAPVRVVTALRTLGEANPTQTAGNSALKRLVRRIEEFTESCPICLDDHPTGMKIFGCCGYCVCERCFETCGTRCAFCRTPVPSALPRTSFTVQEEDEEDSVRLEYPPPPAALTTGTAFSESLQRVVSPRNRQTANLTLTLHALVNDSRKRILIVIEKDRMHEDLSRTVDVRHLSLVTGIRIERIDDKLSGKGTGFSKIKAMFDSATPYPMALLSFGMHAAFLVGTNLDHADSMVTVGDIEGSMLTQAVNRIFRPRVDRDNSQPVVMVKMHM